MFLLIHHYLKIYEWELIISRNLKNWLLSGDYFSILHANTVRALFLPDRNLQHTVISLDAPLSQPFTFSYPLLRFFFH